MGWNAWVPYPGARYMGQLLELRVPPTPNVCGFKPTWLRDTKKMKAVGLTANKVLCERPVDLGGTRKGPEHMLQKAFL